MRWTDRIIRDEDLNPYLNGREGGGLVSRVGALLKQQRESWPLVREGYESLAQVQTKRVRVGESSVIVQHNPKRIRSTAAQVDKASVAERRCFLCPQNLPAEEKGIAYRDDLIILCNPYPVLDHHLSIVHREHVEQKFDGNIDLMLDLARDLAPDYFVLYNGPQSGASAPDHLHFQACSRAGLPIEEDARSDGPQTVEGCASCEETARESFELFTLSDCGRSVIVLRGGQANEVASWTYRILGELARDSESPEPMVNLISTFNGGLWTVYLFPRTRHRPSHFYAEAGERLLVSPGAIDMAGVVVVPEESHFEKIDQERLEAIFAEVSYSEDAANEIVERVCSVAEEGI